MVCCNTVRMISSGVMAGLVAVSAGAGVYKPYGAQTHAHPSLRRDLYVPR
jgi:ammonia channel protein AmtB